MQVNIDIMVQGGNYYAFKNANAYFDPDDHLDDLDDDDNIDYTNEKSSIASPRSGQTQVWKNADGHLSLYPPTQVTTQVTPRMAMMIIWNNIF